MENKLQELTQKLYDEGLSKGRQEADTLVADARARAQKIVAEAEAEAAKIRRQAEESAADLRKNTLTELNIAGKQAMERIRTSLSDMIVEKATNDAVSQAAIDPAFIKEMLIAVAGNWSGSSAEAISLKALLPEALKAKLDKGAEAEIGKQLAGGIEIEYTDGVKSGFRVGPKDGGYYISFTGESFDALLGEYLRPKVKEILYGNQK